MELNKEQLVGALSEALSGMLGAHGGSAGPAITFGETAGGGFAVPANPGGFGGPAPAASMMPAGAMAAAGGGGSNVSAVLVPVAVQTPEGECTTYLSFDGSWGASMPALFNLLQQLSYAGVPLKIWKPKRQNWDGNNRGGGGFGGGRGGGGYNRGGGEW